MLSISTEWMNPHADLKAWLAQVKEFGFDGIELSYKVTRHQLDKIEPLLKEVDLSVSSIHNFCPGPDDEDSHRHLSNYYRLSAIDEHERQQAVKWTNNSVDTALRFGAGVVIIHAGALDFENERSPKLFELYENGQKDSETFRLERKRILDLREEKKRPFLAALEQSLNEVLSHSQAQGVMIGLETRYYPIEIPNFDEIEYFLNLFSEKGLGYWHDVGHADMNDRLGIVSHIDLLEAYKDHLIGVHLHGMSGRYDHLAPFEGDLDLGKYLPYFGKNVLRVVESKSFASVELVKAAVAELKS